MSWAKGLGAALKGTLTGLAEAAEAEEAERREAEEAPPEPAEAPAGKRKSAFTWDMIGL